MKLGKGCGLGALGSSCPRADGRLHERREDCE